MRRPKFRIGLRTIKSVLAVTIAMFVASLFGELSIFPALSAFAVMSRTFDEGLLECRNQAVGIAIGGIIGCTTTLLMPDPPIWIMGLGVMLIIVICTSLKVTFSCGLSVAIFIVSCMTAKDEVIVRTLTRLFHTAMGLMIGLAINYLIVPYDNSSQIFSLFRKAVDDVPALLDQSVIRGLYPDLIPYQTLIEQLKYEMTIYHHQHFRHKQAQKDAYTYMCGCLQLAERMLQELSCLCTMDMIGIPDQEGLARLEDIGLEIPPWDLLLRSSTEEDNTVTSYHLKKLLDARAFLDDMLNARPK